MSENESMERCKACTAIVGQFTQAREEIDAQEQEIRDALKQKGKWECKNETAQQNP